MIKVKKRNNKLEDFDPNKINKFVEKACENLENVSVSEIIIDSKISFRDGIPTTEIDDTLELTARSKAWYEPNYSYVAARILLSSIYKELFGTKYSDDKLENIYKEYFIKNIKKLVKEGILREDALNKFDLNKLASALDISRDKIFKYIGIKNLYDRYFLRINDKIKESPQGFYMRVAMGLSLLDDDPTSRAIELYNIYSKHLASPSTPTLFNSLTIRSQLSSCHLTQIDDSIDGIFEGLWQEARKSKYAGGLGLHMGGIRGTGSHIKGTNGVSTGLIPWLKIYNDMLVAVDQGSKRPGSGCVYIEPWHPDIEEFLEIKKAVGEERRKCHDLNTALWCPDLFFKRIKEDGQWLLICPSVAPELHETYGIEFEKLYIQYEEKVKNKEVIGRFLPAKELWKKILKSLFETSHPFITFKDTGCNSYTNIHSKMLHGYNLCCEVMLGTKSSKYKEGKKIEPGSSAVCNLSSINLSKFIINNTIDWENLELVTRNIVRALDIVIDLNFYPSEESKIGAFSDRAIGLGTMGWSDVYTSMHIEHDSLDALKLTSKIMEFISYISIDESCNLSQKFESYQDFNGSLWSKGIMPHDRYKEIYKEKHGKYPEQTETLDWRALRNKCKAGIRNGNILAIAPTASISYQVGCEQSIEPPFSVVFRYENKSGNNIIINENFINDMKKLDLWNMDMATKVKESGGNLSLIPEIPDNIQKLYKSAFDCDQKKLIDLNAARQQWVDQSISFNLYNKHTSLKYLSEIYIHAWEMGLKSTYYLRNKAATQIQQVVNKPEQVCSINNPDCESCQ